MVAGWLVWWMIDLIKFSLSFSFLNQISPDDGNV